MRTPVARRNGALKDVHPVVLGAMALRELAQRTKIDPAVIEDVVFGCVSQVGEQSPNIARNVVLQAGLPDLGAGAPRWTGNAALGQQAIHFAANLISSASGRDDRGRRREHDARADGIVVGGRRRGFIPAGLAAGGLSRSPHQGVAAEMIAAKSVRSRAMSSTSSAAQPPARCQGAGRRLLRP